MTHNYPTSIFTGCWCGGHIQGIAVDQERGEIYCSFTTELIKLKLDGTLIGSVRGFTGHLGCLAFHNGRVYASLEYKNDAIGSFILQKMGMETVQNAFYLAIFDGKKITQPDMNAEEGRVMTTVWLREPLEDYLAVWEENGKTVRHRHGCSGIDGITVAPSFEGSGTQLLIAYGIYSDLDRTDNDDQVILAYDPDSLLPFETVLTSDNIHTSGPASCQQKYFLRTGNTRYGIQNMEYDPCTGDIFLAVYEGKKPNWPNFPMYVIDGSKPAGLRADGTKELYLKEVGKQAQGIWGYPFPLGSTGMAALGNGLFYFSPHEFENGKYQSHIQLYRYTGEPDALFLPVE